MTKITGYRSVAGDNFVSGGSAVFIPRSGTGSAGDYGQLITDRDRVFAITREPVAFRTVFTVARDIFNKWFQLELEGAKEEDSKTFDKEIQAALTQLHAKREAIQMGTFERGFGWAIIVLGYEDEAKTLRGALKNPTALREVKTYGPTQISNVETEKDRDSPRYGLPVMYKIYREGLPNLLVHYTRVIHVATRWVDPTRPEWKGTSVLDPIWDDVVTLRNERWSMGQTMYRYGGGFPDITFKERELSQIQAWVDAGRFDDLFQKNFFAHSEKEEIDFKGIAGRALDPMNYYLPPMEHISCGTGIPLAILRGVQAGALTGSEVNQQEYYGVISDEQTAYEPALRQLIDIIRELGVAKELEEKGDNKAAKKTRTALATCIKLDQQSELAAYKFSWFGGFELSEEKKKTIELLESQRLRNLGMWHTRNELRKMEDPEAEDLPEGQGGDEILGGSSSPAPQITEGGAAFHVRKHSDGSHTVSKLR